MLTLTNPDVVMTQMKNANKTMAEDGNIDPEDLLKWQEMVSTWYKVNNTIRMALVYNISLIITEKSDSPENFESSTDDLICSMAELVSGSSLPLQISSNGGDKSFRMNIIWMNENMVYNDSEIDKWCW